MEVEQMVTKRDDRPTDRVNIKQSASGRLEGRVLQLWFNIDIIAVSCFIWHMYAGYMKHISA